MESSSSLEVLAFFVFLILSAFFSSSETAFTAVNRIKLRHLLEKKPQLSRRLEPVYRNPKRLLTAILLGNNVANVAAATLATAVLMSLFTEMGIKPVAAMSIITAVMTIILLIFGEITPKTIALRHPEGLAIFLSRPIIFFLYLFRPFVWIFDGITTVISKAFGLTAESDPSAITMDEMKTMLEVGGEEGVIEPEQKEMLNSIFEFSDTVVREIMTPRTDTICMSVDQLVRDAIHLIMAEGHSRIPVYEEKVDNILGVIYAKDLLGAEDTGDSIRKFMRQAVFIPESKGIDELLQHMKEAQFHMAIVVDEYGGMAGIVTMEDILEEIFGEIRDEFDEEGEAIEAVSEDLFVVDAGVNLDDFGDEMSVSFPQTDDYDTLGGFALSQFGDFPSKGEEFEFSSLLFRVKSIDKRRILEFEVQRLSVPDSDTED